MKGKIALNTVLHSGYKLTAKLDFTVKFAYIAVLTQD